MSAKIHHIEPFQNDAYKALILDIKNSLKENLSGLITNMLNGADDTLFHLAELAESNEDQNHYFDTMRMLRLERKNIGENFFSSLKEYLKPISQSQATNNQLAFDEDELTLVDQETMEEMVAISAMHSKAMNLFGNAVNHLEARLEFLAMKTTKIFEKNALQPKNICEAFQNALKNVELSTRNKLILYKLFDQEVMSKMEDCYQSINNLLIAENILPQIKLGKSSPPTEKKHPSYKTQMRNSETVDTVDDADFLTCNVETTSNYANASVKLNPEHISSSRTAQPQNEIDRVLHQFLHGDIINQHDNASNAINTTAAKGAQYYDRRDILNALSKLQHTNQDDLYTNNTIDVEGFKRSLINHMVSKQGGAITKQVNQLDEKTIDFIEMLFEVIVEDNTISEVITNLILRLQIPVIKVAMLDEEIFKNGNHPARQLLNLIADTGKSIDNKADDLYPALENEVDTLLKEFDVDIVSFQKAIDNINSIISKNQLLTEENEKKTQKNILQEHARSIVLTEMQYRLKNKRIPSLAHPLILKHWSTLMFHRYIRNGRDSIAWKEASNILVLIINSLQPIKSESAWYSINNNYKDLLVTLKDYLNETKINIDDIESSLLALKEAYTSMIDASEFKHEKVIIDSSIADSETTDSVCEIEEEFTLESHKCDIEFLEEAINNAADYSPDENDTNPVDSESEIARSKIASLPREVRPGVWFEIYNGEDRAIRRLKLSVIIMEEAKLIFVDRLGKKVIEKDAAQFIEELDDSKSKIIADHSVFDNALSKVITSLAANA